MKPKLDKEIWVKFEVGGCIDFYKEKVIALGKDMFFHAGALDNCLVEEYRRPLYYEDYGITWFTSLSQIKKQYKVKKIDDDYYEEVYNG